MKRVDLVKYKKKTSFFVISSLYSFSSKDHFFFLRNKSEQKVCIQVGPLIHIIDKPRFKSGHALVEEYIVEYLRSSL